MHLQVIFIYLRLPSLSALQKHSRFGVFLKKNIRKLKFSFSTSKWEKFTRTKQLRNFIVYSTKFQNTEINNNFENFVEGPLK